MSTTIARVTRLRTSFLALLFLVPAWAGPESPPRPELAEGSSSVDYNKAGRALNAAVKALGKALEARDVAALRGLVHPEGLRDPAPAWERVEDPAVRAPVEAWRWQAGPGTGAGADAAVAFLEGIRGSIDHPQAVASKVNLLERVEPGLVTASVRTEVLGPDGAGRRAAERALLATRWAWVDDELRLVGLGLRGGDGAAGPGDLFPDRASQQGLRFTATEDPRFLPPSTALRYQVIRHAIGGATAGDIDGDGWDDVVLTGGEALAVFLNQQDGSFRPATQEVGLAGILHANATLLVDFDGDDDQDLYVGRFYGPNLLFRNEGRGTFVDVTAGSGLAEDDMTAVLACADFNGDGNLDLYVGRFLDARSAVPDTMLYSRNGAPNRLYLGGGDLTFRDVSAASGADDAGLTLGVGAADFDGDGDQDLYLSNDYGRNVLYENQGDATFVDASLERGALGVSAGMSVAWGDVDGDQLLDLYVSSIRSNQRWFSEDVNIRRYLLNIVQSERRERLQELFLDLRKHMGQAWDRVGYESLKGNLLLRQASPGRFEDVGEAAGAQPAGWFWSSGLFDVDLDGDLDVFAVDGWVTGKKKDDL
jgi:hypothetical protein